MTADKVLVRGNYREAVWLHSYEDHELGQRYDLQTDGRISISPRIARQLAKALTKWADSVPPTTGGSSDD